MRIPGLEFHLEAEEVAWRPTAVEGVQWFLLASEGAPEQDAEDGEGTRPDAATGGTVLIRMEPGRGYPPHRHLDVEEVLVLAGGYRDGEGVHRAGDFVRYPRGSAHAPVAEGDPGAPVGPHNPACVLFASARGGIEVLGEGARIPTRGADVPGAPEPPVGSQPPAPTRDP